MMKKTQGRKKIEMKKIVDRSSLQVTFSKRRVGVFKKASELCVLTGAEAAVIVESPGNRVYAFGHPSVESLVDRYVAGSSEDDKPAINNEVVVNDKLNQEYLEINKKMEDEKRKKVDAVSNKAEEEEDGPFWWEQPFDNLGAEELEEYIASLEALKNNMIQRANDLHTINNSSMFNANQSSITEGFDKLSVTQNAAGHKEHGDQSASTT